MELFEKYPERFEILKDLFQSRRAELNSQEIKERLNMIFKTCERKWQENLKRLDRIKIKYLLIAEAAPWTEEGEVRYFYNTFDGNWVKRIWYAFYESAFPDNIEHGLRCLAKKQFLLIDSLPFAVKYSSYYRKKVLYSELVQCCSDFIIEKMNDKIKWASDVKLALAFKLNGGAIIKAFPNGLKLPTGQIIKLSIDHIASDRSGYTNKMKLRKIWDIDQQYVAMPC
jgi:hypothetical protein